MVENYVRVRYMDNQSEKISMKKTPKDLKINREKNDERVVHYEALPNSECVVKYTSDPGIDKTREVEKSMASQLGIFVLSHSKRIMKRFVIEIDGLYSNTVYYQDTDSLYIHENH